MSYQLILGEFFQVNNPPIYPRIPSQNDLFLKDNLFQHINQQTSASCQKDKDFKSEILNPEKQQQQYIKPPHIKSNLTQTCMQMKRDSFRAELNRKNLNQILSSKRKIEPTQISVEDQFTSIPLYNQHNQANQFSNIYDAIQEQTYGFIEAWKLKRQIEFQILQLSQQKQKHKQYTYLNLISEQLKTKLIFRNNKKKFTYGNQYKNTFYFIQNNHQQKIQELYKIKEQQENTIKTQASSPIQIIKSISKGYNQSILLEISFLLIGGWENFLESIEIQIFQSQLKVGKKIQLINS